MADKYIDLDTIKEYIHLGTILGNIDLDPDDRKRLEIETLYLTGVEKELSDKLSIPLTLERAKELQQEEKRELERYQAAIAGGKTEEHALNIALDWNGQSLMCEIAFGVFDAISKKYIS